MDTFLGCRKDVHRPWGYEDLSKTDRGIVSVMTRIEVSCKLEDYCPHLPNFTMLQMLLLGTESKSVARTDIRESGTPK